MRLVALAAAVLAAVVGGVVFLWPAPASGPEPIAYGRDTCATCRMHLARSGFAAQMRDAAGALTRYDDVGCLVRAILAAHREVPAAWVEDHAGGGFVPLLAAHLVHADGTQTPMGSGLVAFADEAVARAHARDHRGRVMAFEDVLHDSTLLARLAGPPASGAGRTP